MFPFDKIVKDADYTLPTKKIKQCSTIGQDRDFVIACEAVIAFEAVNLLFLSYQVIQDNSQAVQASHQYSLN